MTQPLFNAEERQEADGLSGRSLKRPRHAVGLDSCCFKKLEVPVFRPTLEEWKLGLERYIEEVIEPTGIAYDIGLCKIIPPQTFAWNKELPHLESRLMEDSSYRINPIRQHTSGMRGCFRLDLVGAKALTPREFKAAASSNSSVKAPKEGSSLEEYERAFWRSIGPNVEAPLYGADNLGTLFKEDGLDGWNLNALDTLLHYGFEGKKGVAGVTSPMLYYGMWRAMFAWHTEDMELNSVNYLHVGAPKVWYTVPPCEASRIESFSKMQFAEEANVCQEFLRHKKVMISPSQLFKAGVQTVSAIQNVGEYMVTFPRAYHAGFNCGFNVAEAVNFATSRWVPFGKRAKWCKCEKDSVHMNVDLMVERLRRVLPQRLPALPEPGDRVMVRWAADSWPGEYLLRVKKRISPGVYSAELAFADKSFGEWEFSLENDQWRWPEEKDVQLPKTGDHVFIRWGDWDQQEYYVRVAVAADGDMIVVDPKGDPEFGEYSFDPYRDCWRWPDPEEARARKGAQIPLTDETNIMQNENQTRAGCVSQAAMMNERSSVKNNAQQSSSFARAGPESSRTSHSPLSSSSDDSESESDAESQPAPFPGSIICIKWEGWEKWYLVRVVGRRTGLAVVSASGDSSFGEWEFNPRQDDWKWPQLRVKMRPLLPESKSEAITEEHSAR